MAKVLTSETLFSWLHIADIQAGGAADPSLRWDQSLVLDEMKRDIAAWDEHRLPAPDAIFVTGDIAYSGCSEQYAVARTWLADVAESVGLGPDRVFVVPGNHDVDRNRNRDKATVRLVDSLRTGKESLDEVLRDPDDRRRLAARFHDYLGFAIGFGSGYLQAHENADDKLFWTCRFDSKRGLSVRVIGLDTAILSADDTDRGKLRVGISQLGHGLGRLSIEHGELIVALSHHPLNAGWVADEKEINAWLRRYAHLHLHAHTHDAGSEAARTGGGGGVVRVAAGSRRYCFASVSEVNSQAVLQVWPRTWLDKEKRFTLDVHQVPDGQSFAQHALRLSLTKEEVESCGAICGELADERLVSQLRSRVREALGLAGFVITESEAIKEFGMLATQSFGLATAKALVACTFYEPSEAVPQQRIVDFSSQVATLREGGTVDYGILVTNSTWSPEAMSGVTNVRVVTVDDLYRSIFDFAPYLRAGIADFERSTLNKTFVSPKMKRHRATDLSTDGSAEDANEPIDITAYCDEWATTPEGARLCLLGDFGSGKTSFSRWYWVRQARKHLDAPREERVPLIVPLHKFSKALDVKSMLTDFLANDCGIPNLRMSAFQALVEEGHFLIILDGFDEMARHVDREVRYRTISDLGCLAKGKSKVILTGRPGYFPNHEELAQVLEAGFQGEDLYEAARGALEELVDYELFELCPFTAAQIDQFVRKCTPSAAEADDILRYISTTYNLMDLASRPVLLEMVVKSLPRLLASKNQGVINAAKLYDVYTGLWIDREERKGEFRKLIRKIDKIRFMEELAYQMFLEDKIEIPYLHLGRPIKAFFRIDEEDKLDHFSHDVRTCSFLRRRHASYGFAHRSFQEFFIAKKLIADALRHERSSWAARHLPREVSLFASELLAGDQNGIGALLFTWATQQPDSILARNCVAVGCLANQPVPKGVESIYGMTEEVLRSYVKTLLGRTGVGAPFWRFLYDLALRLVREKSAIYLKSDIADHASDVTSFVLERLLTRPLMTSKELERNVAMSAHWIENDRLRAKRRREQREVLLDDFDIDMIPSVNDAADEQIAEKEQAERFRAALRAAIECLSDDERTLIREYYTEGKSVTELARSFKVSPSVVSTRLHRMQNRLRHDVIARVKPVR